MGSGDVYKRQEHKVSQQDFAQYLGVTRQTISSLENGRYNPSILLAMKIARYFGKSVENIFIYTEEEDNDET